MPPIDLPLFPIDLVLVPAMPQLLRIFEPRYREMIRLCLQGDRRFGMVLIREGEESDEMASPCAVGTVAEIVGMAHLEDDAFVILTEGRQRFRIIEQFHDLAYLHGMVELLDEPVGPIEHTSPLAVEVHGMAMEYLSLALKAAGEDPDEIALPDDPLALSYKVLSVLKILDSEKQRLLEIESAAQRLRAEARILQREVLILERMLQPPMQGTGYFHPN